ncbi:MAG: SDR family oxidoreductase [Bifidobacteriaceae bacterium]|jgi:NADP-dependent 3-hydroxy acid dehydrogenase YdfG|nr:SDR family oxidoreductase [Bifidobacteriaceae bacterium]MCI1914942.1 SDR family oxidoreductase [Bifidobacteriaceae bacterium]
MTNGQSGEEVTTKRAVVTGASSGIGEASVRSLVADGWKVVALARRENRLASLAQETGCEYFVCDVTDEESTSAAVHSIVTAGPVDALVNCAGGALGTDRVADAKVEEWRWMYETNVLGTLRITQKLLPALKEREGSVVMITSTAGIDPYEGGAGYCGVKSAEKVLARVLRLEQLGEPVRIIDIAPGLVKTAEFSLNRLHGDQAAADAVYAGVPDPLTGEDIAEAVRWALDQPKTVDIDEMVVRPRAQVSSTKVYRTK